MSKHGIKFGAKVVITVNGYQRKTPYNVALGIANDLAIRVRDRWWKRHPAGAFDWQRYNNLLNRCVRRIQPAVKYQLEKLNRPYKDKK